MGMSIDEAIEHGKEQLEIFGGEHKEFIETSIDIMHKYQKIQQIYERFQKDGAYYHHMTWLDVMEVLEDGNDSI